MRAIASSLLVLVVGVTHAAAPPWSPRDALGDELPRGAIARFGSSRLSHGGSISDVTFSSDGKRLLSVGYGAMLWDLPSGKLLAEYADEDHSLNTGLFGWGADVFLLGNSRSSRWDTETGTVQALPDQAGRDDILGVGTSCPVEKALILGATGGKVLFVEPMTNRVLTTIECKMTTLPREMAYSPDYRWGVTICNGGRLHGWDRTASKPGWRSEEPTGQSELRGCQFAPSWPALAYLHNDHLYLLDPATGKEVAGFTRPAMRFQSFAFSPDGKRIVGIDDENRLHHLNARTGKIVSTITLAPAVLRMLEAWPFRAKAYFSSGARFVALIEPSSRWIAVLDTTTGKPLHPDIVARRTPNFLQVSDNARVRCVLGDQFVTWKARCGQVVGRPATLPGLRQDEQILDLRPGRAMLLKSRDRLRVVHPTTGVQMMQIEDQNTSNDWYASLDPTGTRLARISLSEILIYQTQTGRKLRSVAREKMQAARDDGRTVWSSDGRHLLVHDVFPRWMNLVELATGQSRFRQRFYTDRAPVLSKDGKLLAVIEQNRIVRVWSIHPARELMRCADVYHPTQVSLSPRNKYVAVAFDTTAILYDMQGRRLGDIPGHRATINAMEFSPDERLLLTTSYDGTALVWDLDELTRPKQQQPPAAPPFPRAVRDLASLDAATSLAALDALERQPTEAVKLVGAFLQPARATDAKLVAKWIADLDSDEQSIRQRAAAQLQRLDIQAEAALTTAVKATKSAEVQRAGNRLLDAINGPIRDPERLREARAVELLERIATAEAKALLAKLAKGADARLTREARAALERMTGE